MNEAEQFFYDNAGFSFNPAIETADEGKRRGAAKLATAEAHLIAGPYYIGVEPDDMPWDGDVEYDGPLWFVVLYDVTDSSTGTVLGSLGGVACETTDDPYIRVVSAELALEYLPVGKLGPCRAYAMCENEANQLYDFGPVGMVPTCQRCADKTDRLRAN